MRSIPSMLAASLAFAIASVSAQAQDMGVTTVAGLTGLCDAFLNSTPFYDAAAAAGFQRNPATDEVFFGPGDAVVAFPPEDAFTCGVMVYHLPEENLVIYGAVEQLAFSRGMSLTVDREHSVTEQDQMWLSRWEAPAEHIRLIDLKTLDGSPVSGAYNIMLISMDR